MNIRRFRALHQAGASYAEIARECGCDWRTVRRYLADDAPAYPPAGPPRAGTQPRVITPELEAVIEALLHADISIKASVIHERLADEHGFTGHYQRVKMFCATARPRIADELAVTDENPLSGLHRRFATTPGAQAQVDWGEEGDLFGTGVKVYSFHMVLSYSRDPFCCFTTSMDMNAFWGSHARAFTHFGGVPATIVYDRTKTVIRRHVGPGIAVPLHPFAVGFAGHYGFDIDVLAAYRPTGKGRVERQVTIVRDHVLAARSFRSLADADRAFAAWVPIRRSQTHRTHGHLIGVRAAPDHAALRPLPATAYVTSLPQLRTVGKDTLVSFGGSFYSTPARAVRPGQRVAVHADGDVVTISRAAADGGGVLARHAAATERGSWIIEAGHWDGLPDGHTRATTTDPDEPSTPTAHPRSGSDTGPLAGLLARRAPQVHVAARSLQAYEQVANR